MKKRVAVLGATGSIGKSTLDVLRHKRDCFEPVLFSAHKNHHELLNLKQEFPGVLTALVCDNPIPPEIDFTGRDGLLNAIASVKADITVNGITGAAGLEPSVASIMAGSDLALANKESVVMAGDLIFSLAREKNTHIIPVDSEHTAILKLLEAHGRENVSEIILTASGGPFRNYSMEKLAAVTPEEALSHPTRNMGPKITVDSATLANKGLEVIEAAFYFGFPPEKIKVIIHPQSIVHSMVRLNNGAVYAQMSKPDMRLVIHDALTWPETAYSPFGFLDFDSLNLSFEKPDPERFPMLALAYEALRGTPILPIVYNAANEAAVQVFLEGKIKFLEIPGIVGYVINQGIFGEKTTETVENILDWDRKARALAGEYIGIPSY
jgi:1-deoxy-D-xylulose-5-phosphate reductoisomerase